MPSPCGGLSREGGRCQKRGTLDVVLAELNEAFSELKALIPRLEQPDTPLPSREGRVFTFRSFVYPGDFRDTSGMTGVAEVVSCLGGDTATRPRPLTSPGGGVVSRGPQKNDRFPSVLGARIVGHRRLNAPGAARWVRPVSTYSATESDTGSWFFPHLQMLTEGVSSSPRRFRTDAPEHHVPAWCDGSTASTGASALLQSQRLRWRRGARPAKDQGQEGSANERQRMWRRWRAGSPR